MACIDVSYSWTDESIERVRRDLDAIARAGRTNTEHRR